MSDNVGLVKCRTTEANCRTSEVSDEVSMKCRTNEVSDQ